MNLLEVIFNEAKSGNFKTTYCSKCKVFAWPPNYYCRVCNKKTTFRKVNKDGVLLEKSFSNLEESKGHYGIGEFSGLRVLGTLEDNLEINDKIRITYLSIKNKKIEIGFSKI